MFVKSEPSPLDIYLLSGNLFKIQTFWPPDIINFHIKFLFVITYVRVNKFALSRRRRRNAHTFDCFDWNGTDTFQLPNVIWPGEGHVTPSFLARDTNENPSSKTSRPLTTSSLATLKFIRLTCGKCKVSPKVAQGADHFWCELCNHWRSCCVTWQFCPGFTKSKWFFDENMDMTWWTESWLNFHSNNASMNHIQLRK